MSDRTGLAAETCSRAWAAEMAVIPALAGAFEESSLEWFHNPKATFPVPAVAVRGWASKEIVLYPAPTVREMLVWLNDKADLVSLLIEQGVYSGWVYDPDALARVCIAAARSVE